MRRRPYVLDLASAGVLLAVAMWWLVSACGVEQQGKDWAADFAEVSYCEFEPCGQVFLCETTLPYGDTLTPELCWVDDNADELAQALVADYGETTCKPTPRGGSLGWPCLYCCGAHCGRGANAYQGSFCGGQ